MFFLLQLTIPRPHHKIGTHHAITCQPRIGCLCVSNQPAVSSLSATTTTRSRRKVGHVKFWHIMRSRTFRISERRRRREKCNLRMTDQWLEVVLVTAKTSRPTPCPATGLVWRKSETCQEVSFSFSLSVAVELEGRLKPKSIFYFSFQSRLNELHGTYNVENLLSDSGRCCSCAKQMFHVPRPVPGEGGGEEIRQGHVLNKMAYCCTELVASLILVAFACQIIFNTEFCLCWPTIYDLASRLR